jgi:uncharacterized membrane protein
MYPIVLALHNIVRWLVLILGVVAVLRAFVGWFGKREWTEIDRKIGSYVSITIDIQILLGLILYFISPLTKLALSNFGTAMQVVELRFFTLEHVFYMLLALLFAHLGSILPKRAAEAIAKHKWAAIFFSLTVLFILLGIPWGRPLFPGL